MTETKELYFERAKNTRRLSALLFDTFLSLVVGALLLLLTFYLLSITPQVISFIEAREELSISSGLYTEEGETTVLSYDLIYEDNTLSVDEKSEKIDNLLIEFFSMASFFENGDGKTIYINYKNNAVSSTGEKMFNDGQRALLNDDFDSEYLDFYGECYTLALGYLSNNSEYNNATRGLVIYYTFSIIATLLFPFIIFLYVIPMSLFRRNRQTLGMKISRIAVVTNEGLHVGWKRFTLRFLFLYVVEIALSLFSFLVPFAISFGMMLLSKTHQSLHDYLFDTYIVNLDRGKIYMDKEEYILEHPDVLQEK